MGDGSTNIPRLACPHTDYSRYQQLRPESSTKPSYFFALNIRQKVSILPTLIGSIVDTIRFLGPENCALSVVEGHSQDGTFEILDLLKAEIEKLGTTFYLKRSDIDPATNIGRIAGLAALRNLALEPLTENPSAFTRDATVIFLNDVSLCAEDILELIYQKALLGADMTCGFDWTYVGVDPTFYDVWIARTLAGDSFFDIPPDGNWNSAWNLFWNAHTDQKSFMAHRPFQVFSCWNGAAVFTSRPLIEAHARFRAPTPQECFQGEPQLFCKDLWRAGYRNIAVVPSVNIAYDDEHATSIKGLKGYVSQWMAGEPKEGNKIEWQDQPPEKVRCIASYEKQEWRAWNEGA